MGNVKQYMAKPKVSPTQLVLLGAFIGWMIISNLKWFADLNPIYQISMQIGFYIAIMLSAGKLGNVVELLRSFMKVIVGNNQTSDQIVIQLQNMIVALCQQLGLYYEDELKKIEQEYLKKETKEQKIARIQKELKNLE